MASKEDRTTMSAADCKAKGNEFLKTQDYDTAISWYTSAIEKDPTDKVFYSNRSAAHLQKGDAEAALADGTACIAAQPDWAKGYNRKGCALHALKQYDEAIATFEAGLKIAPGSALLTGPMKEAQTAKTNSENAGSKMPTFAQWSSRVVNGLTNSQFEVLAKIERDSKKSAGELFSKYSN